MNRTLMDRSAQALPNSGQAYERATNVFAGAFFRYIGLVSKTAHWIGGQYLSRAHRGDPGAEPPIVPVPLATQQRALTILDNYLFSDRRLSFSPNVLNKLGYSEWAGYGYVGWEGYGNLPVWAYNPPERHDFPAVENIGNAQRHVIDFLFMPQTLGRLEQNPLQSNGPTLTMDDLFAWMQRSIYRELTDARAHGISLLRRNLQSIYELKLIALATAPSHGTPDGASAMARLELHRLLEAANAKLRAGGLDDVTQAHLALLAGRAASALKP